MSNGATVVRAKPGEAYVYDALLLYAHDGDTVKCCVSLDQSVRHKDADLGFHVYIEANHLVLHESFRLFGLNAPELNTPAGKVALAFVKDWLDTNCVKSNHGGDVAYEVRLSTTPTGADQEKYGRWLAVVLPTKSGRKTTLNQALLDSKNAADWDGQGTKPLPT